MVGRPSSKLRKKSAHEFQRIFGVRLGSEGGDRGAKGRTEAIDDGSKNVVVERDIFCIHRRLKLQELGLKLPKLSLPVVWVVGGRNESSSILLEQSDQIVLAMKDLNRHRVLSEQFEASLHTLRSTAAREATHEKEHNL